MDPTTIAALIKGGSDLLGKAMAPAAPAGPSYATSGATGSSLWFDNSGWTVATGGSTASAVSGDRFGPTSGALTPNATMPQLPAVKGVVTPTTTFGDIVPNNATAAPKTLAGSVPTGALLVGALVVLALIMKR